MERRGFLAACVAAVVGKRLELFQDIQILQPTTELLRLPRVYPSLRLVQFSVGVTISKEIWGACQETEAGFTQLVRAIQAGEREIIERQAERLFEEAFHVSE